MRRFLPILKAPKKITILVCLITLGFFIYQSPDLLAIARGYTTDDRDIRVGMIAALSTDSTDNNRVERGASDSSERIVGVVTTIENSVITVASGDSKVLVENEGEVEAYVSNINGEVKKGDGLVISSFRGILMKAGTTPGNIIALAVTDYSLAAPETYDIKGESAQEGIKVVKLKVNLNKEGTANSGAITDSSLSRLGQAITGKEISEIRLVVALVIFFIVVIAQGGILYGAIFSTITAIGRNPLARKMIRSELLRVIMVSIFVLLFGLAAIYAVLWL